MTTLELWHKLFSSLGSKPQEFPTTPKSNRKPLWFSAYIDGNCIYVRNAKEHQPSCSILGERKLTYKEFEQMYPIYLKREQGEPVSKEAQVISFNQVYWYSLIKHCC
jgi:hypothetical protein